jgi:hypothetical protein
MLGLMMGASDHADFLAGVADSVTDRARDADDFANPAAEIRTVQVRGLRTARRGAVPRCFTATNISAPSLGTARLVNVAYGDGGEAFGFFLRRSVSGRAIRSVSGTDTVTRARWRWDPLSAGAGCPDALAIDLLGP